MSALPFVITNAGLSALATATSLAPVTITGIQVGTGIYTPSVTNTALVAPISTTISLVGSSVPGTGMIHMTFEDITGNAYTINEIGLFAGSTLFAIYSQSAGIMTKAAGAIGLFSIDLALTNTAPGTVSISGNAAFNYPPATESTAGVLAIASTALVNAGTDNTTAVSPAKLAARLATIPPGTGKCDYFATTTVPTGWLAANGAAVSRAIYANLFSAIGLTFGIGDGSTTFNLPDLRGVFPRGLDNGIGYDIGRTLGSFQDDAIQLPATTNSHTLRALIVSTTRSGNQAVNGVDALNGLTEATPGGGFSDGYTSSISRASIATASETRPKNIALLACIKY